MVTDMIPMLARLAEVHALRRTAKTVLQTYLGRQTGERVLEGLIHRGDGQEIHAVIWLCDLRGSTRLADTMPRQAFLDLLNEYFECMAGAVMSHDGEVLKFIGDALLAIFPIGAASEHPETCSRHQRASVAALAAAREAMQRMDALNQARRDRGEPPLAFGIALHLGDVMYGNIGAPGRLDFTVIGPAANEAARLEAMCKTLGRPIIISSQFARVLPEPLVSLGFHALRGVHEPNELFTLPEVACRRLETGRAKRSIRSIDQRPPSLAPERWSTATPATTSAVPSTTGAVNGSLNSTTPTALIAATPMPRPYRVDEADRQALQGQRQHPEGEAVAAGDNQSPDPAGSCRPST